MKDLRAAIENAVQAIKIELNVQEREQLQADLAAFERWLEPLMAVDVATTEPLIYSFKGTNVFREDKPQTGDLKKLQQIALNFEDGFYRVPSIIE